MPSYRTNSFGAFCPELGFTTPLCSPSTWMLCAFISVANKRSFRHAT